MKTFTFILVLLAPVAAFGRQGTLSPGYYICESMGGDTSYFSDIFLGPGDGSAVGKAFAQMLATKYGYSGRISCPIAFKTAEGLKQLQDQHEPYAAQRAQQGRKIVETGWTYNGAPSLSTGSASPEPSGSAVRPASGPPASGGVPSAPKPDAQTAYEQALEAQRPHSVSQAQLAAATTPATAVPSGGTVPSHAASAPPNNPAAHAPAAAQNAATPAAGTYFVCTWPTSAAGVLTDYVSDVNGPFDFKSAGPALEDLSRAFRNFLTAKYHPVGGSVSCVYQFSQAGAEALKKRDLTTGYQGYTHVDTGWKDGQTAAPAAVASSPATSAPVAAASSTPYYCYSKYKFPGAARQTDYTTGVFTLTASYGWTRLWWSAYMHQTYHIPVDAKTFEVDCNQLPAAADKQQQVLSRNVTNWKDRNEDVVQVSWKPTQTAPVGAAEPSVNEMLSGQIRPQDHAPIGSAPSAAPAP